MSNHSITWIDSLATYLTPRRLRAQAIILALCLWGVCAVDFATPGLFDRAGNIKFQDFIQFYISARLIAEHRTSQLFDQQAAFDEMRAILDEAGHHPPTRVRLPTVYGPQVGLLFVPFTRLSFAAAARLWVAFSVLLYFGCLYLAWRLCPNLSGHAGLVIWAAIAFPPFFHFFVRGQLSALLLACFTAALFAFRAKHDWLAGFALGLLIFKPQFLIAIPLVFLLAQAWRALAALVISAAAQLTLTWAIFGSAVMRAYFNTLLHMSRWMALAEPADSHIQMHSLRSFWTLLIPWPNAALTLYVLSSIAVIAIAAAACRHSSNLAPRFSALVLAAVLVNPHLFVYDLLVLAPVFLLLADWILTYRTSGCPTSGRFCQKWGFSQPLILLLYLAFILPLFGPLSRWTHLQLSVPVFAALLWLIWRCSVTPDATADHKLAPNESRVV